jgi:hypothetical protein
MPQIFVNDLPHPLEAPAATWGDLLASLDEKAAGEGLLLTVARFDGVEEPSFRDPHVTARRLATVSRVEVETAAPAAFLRQCILDSIGPLEQAAERAAQLSETYRGHNVGRGHEGLSALALDLQGLTSLAAMLSGPLHVDLSSFAKAGDTLHLDDLAASLDALVAAQESDDWLTVADVLEYDLEPMIRRWIELLTHVAGAL